MVVDAETPEYEEPSQKEEEKPAPVPETKSEPLTGAEKAPVLFKLEKGELEVLGALLLLLMAGHMAGGVLERRRFLELDVFSSLVGNMIQSCTRCNAMVKGGTLACYNKKHKKRSSL